MKKQRSLTARIPALGLAISLFLCIPVLADGGRGVGPADADVPSGMMMEGVNSAMLNASYWTTFPGGSTVLMNDEQIKAFNDSNFADPDCCMYVLPALKETFDGVALRKDLASFSIRRGFL